MPSSDAAKEELRPNPGDGPPVSLLGGEGGQGPLMAAHSVGNVGSSLWPLGEPLRSSDGEETEAGQRARDRLRECPEHGLRRLRDQAKTAQLSGATSEAGTEGGTSVIGCPSLARPRAAADDQDFARRSAEPQGGSERGQRSQREIPQAGENLKVMSEQGCMLEETSRAPKVPVLTASQARFLDGCVQDFVFQQYLSAEAERKGLRAARCSYWNGATWPVRRQSTFG